MTRYCLQEPFPQSPGSWGDRTGLRRKETVAFLKTQATKGPPGRCSRPGACAGCSSRLRAASPAPLPFRSRPALAEWASATPASSWTVLFSASASESPSLRQKPSAWARAGGAGPLRGAATPPASVSFPGGGGGGGFFRRTICSREWPNLGLTPAGE